VNNPNACARESAAKGATPSFGLLVAPVTSVSTRNA